MAKMIESALTRGSFDATLVLEHITPSVIAENLETSFVWDCIAEAAAKHFDLEAAPPAKASASPTHGGGDGDRAGRGARAQGREADRAREAGARIASRRPTRRRSRRPSPAARRRAARPGPARRDADHRARDPGRDEPRAPAPAPARCAAAAAAAGAARRDAVEWDPTDDLDVLDDQPAPFGR